MRIYFDLDGTILDVSLRHYEAYRSICSRFDARPLQLAEFWSLKRGADETRLLMKSGFGEKAFATYNKMFAELIERRELLALDSLFPDSQSTLALLRAMGHRVMLVTLRKSVRNLRDELRSLNMLSIFDEILTRESEIRGEPHVMKAEQISHSKYFCTRDSFVVGDTEVDVLSGKLLGIRVAATSAGQRDRNVLLKYNPDYLISRLSDLPDIVNTESRAS